MHLFAASGRRWDSLEPRALVYSTLGMIIVFIPIIVYLPYCFSLADPYLSRWEAQIAEEHPTDILNFILQYGLLFLAVIAGFSAMVIRFREIGSGMRATLFMVGGLMLTFGYFGISSNRFTETVLVCLSIYAAFSMPQRKYDYYGWFAAVFIGLLALSAVHNSSIQSNTAKVYGTPDLLARSVNLRIVSNHLVKLDNGRSGAVLAPPDDSNVISYFSALPVLATSEWTNTDGLKYACMVFYYEMPEGKADWAKIRNMLKERRVSYVAIPKNFNYASSYMIYGHDRITDPSHTIAYYLIHTDKDKFLPWLKLEKDDDQYRIFSVQL
jgi:hypothetical protein